MHAILRMHITTRRSFRCMPTEFCVLKWSGRCDLWWGLYSFTRILYSTLYTDRT